MHARVQSWAEPSFTSTNACRRLDCLTFLTLSGTEVKLDALLPISHNIVELGLRDSILHAKHKKAPLLHADRRMALLLHDKYRLVSAPDIFNGHWPALITIDLSGASIHARRIGPVVLPVLEHLRMDGFRFR